LWLDILLYLFISLPPSRNWVYLVMYGWPQQVGQASAAAVSRLCEAAVVNVPKKEVTNLSTQPRSWEFLEVHLSVVDRAALACWDDVCLWVVCPVRGTFPPPPRRFRSRMYHGPAAPLSPPPGAALRWESHLEQSANNTDPPHSCSTLNKLCQSVFRIRASTLSFIVHSFFPCISRVLLCSC
jgi:hypothetical protein